MRKIMALAMVVATAFGCEKPGTTFECAGIGGSAGAPVVEPCDGGGGAGGGR